MGTIEENDGFLFRKPLEDGREVTVMPLIYDRARVTIGPQNEGYYDDSW